MPFSHTVKISLQSIYSFFSSKNKLVNNKRKQYDVSFSIKFKNLFLRTFGNFVLFLFSQSQSCYTKYISAVERVAV